ncbi:sensor histidine kinase [Paenibacillus alginolyticus]|uniref:sensor histidine kinase n=1 Tax=Paenibacillus alginolyticus TaxID=59839 RepID=UPI0003F59392|nr:sensor histidine kinase [Paenibacillus alginolyticus]MCY9668654.1 sensor histidine kinase [Paenibacillus alginolyticus]
MKLHKKLMIVYLVTILLPIVGLTNYFLNQMSDLIIRYVSDSYQKILVQSNNGIYYNIRFYESILDNLTVSESVQNVLSEPDVYREKGIIIMNREISRAVRFIQAYQATDVESIEFFSTSPDVMSDGVYLFPVDRLRKVLGLNEIPDSKFWILEQYDGKYYYALVRPIYSIGEFKKIGYIKLTIQIPSVTYVQETRGSKAVDASGSLIIADSKGTIMFNPDTDQLGKPLPQEIVERTSADRSSESELNLHIQGTDYVMWYRKLQNVDWTMYLLVPKASIQSKVNEIRQTIVTVSIICMIIFSFLTLLITRQLTRGIRRLHAKVSRVGRGVLSTSRRVRVKGDEIDELDRNFDNMLDNLRDLIHQNYVEKLERREMELNFLQAQINPHFLYNTLDAIKNEIDMDEKQTAIGMVIALADLFRISVSKGSNTILFEQEIDHANCYLKILEIRFGARHTIEWQIDQRIPSLYTLKIILQPLLENAIQHGLKGMARGSVTVIGELTEQAVIVTVRDNGVGMTKAQAETLLSDHSPSKGIGLYNVNSRIRMYFGSEYGLSIKSELGKGTDVVLTLPVLEEVEHV